MDATLVRPEMASPLDVVEAALINDSFRRVVETGEHEQVVVMTIPPLGDIGSEVHPATDQLFVVVAGFGEAQINGHSRAIGATDLVFVRAGTWHNIVNHGREPLRLITVYAPPAHDPGTVHRTKAEAGEAEIEEY
jgi:mannose-6-phosphate isomerase-like protein (cupin superfamily)